MSYITICPRCGFNIVKPAFDGDGYYPVEPMCRCGRETLAEKNRRMDCEHAPLLHENITEALALTDKEPTT